jgi:hypothetical protein
MNSSRRDRQVMPSKQAKRGVSVDVMKSGSICRKRSVRYDVDNKTWIRTRGRNAPI